METSPKIEKYKRLSASADLSKFDPGFANEHDFIEVTEWHTGEGFDLEICKIKPNGSYENRHLQFTYGEFKAIKKLVKAINEDQNIDDKPEQHWNC